MDLRVFCPFSTCGRAFVTEENLQTHTKRRHNTENQLNCEYTAELASNEAFSKENILKITEEDELEDITSLTITHKGLESFKSNETIRLGDLLSLEYLYISYNSLSNIDGVSELLGLLELDINNNSVQDLAPVSKLTMLRKLFCSNNQITSLTPCEQLKNLHYLSVYNNELSDFRAALSILRSLPRLRKLDFGQNPCMSFAPNAVLVLLSYLDIDSIDGEEVTSEDREIARTVIQTEELPQSNLHSELYREIKQLRKQLFLIKQEKRKLKGKLMNQDNEDIEFLREENSRLKRESTAIYSLLDNISYLREELETKLGDEGWSVYLENEKLRNRLMNLETQKTGARPATSRPATARPRTSRPSTSCACPGNAESVQFQRKLDENQHQIEELQKRLKESIDLL